MVDIGAMSDSGNEVYRWYVLRVIGSRERRVEARLRSESQRLNMTDYIRDVLVPVEKVYQIRNGKKVTKEKVLFSGYVFVEAALVGEVPHFITEQPDVIGFLPRPDGSPSYLQDSEVERLLGREDSQEEGYEQMAVPYEVGDTVKVIDGPFNTFTGVISRVDDEKKKLEILVKIFDRKTPVELSFLQVERGS